MLHPPPIGELLDDHQSGATPGGPLATPRGEPKAVVEHPAADVAGDQQVEHHGDLSIIHDAGGQPRGQLFRDDLPCLRGTFRLRVDLKEGANA